MMKALRMKDIVDKVGLGQSTLYRMIAAGTFPKPFELVPGRTAWLEEDIDAWLAEKAGKKPAAESPADNITQLSAQQGA
ncbi:Prophage CP4-57 regulatory protein (AlpA) [Burkholderia pseudomallei]|uniref:helix-turn-helix transcriptional regulator n=2 Tax=Burkholderia pseudomallei TaxID=28450 RepID=UPI00050E94AE|nr:prophage CP4-57 regulatory family protein [Burkholderia pseudomallei]KGD51968.1 prophage CP4-57 regulatory family protein [Burkholderia pseudomallei]CRY35119.1 prophage CP4-57 regulatory protein (AlpA) [Burkholderia pseudomallei]